MSAELNQEPQPTEQNVRKEKPRVLKSLTEAELQQVEAEATLLHENSFIHNFGVLAVDDLTNRAVELETEVSETSEQIAEPDKRVLAGIKEVVDSTIIQKRTLKVEISALHLKEKRLRTNAINLGELARTEARIRQDSGIPLAEESRQLLKTASDEVEKGQGNVLHVLTHDADEFAKKARGKKGELNEVSTTQAVIADLAARWEVFGPRGLEKRLTLAGQLKDTVAELELDIATLRHGEIAVARKIATITAQNGIEGVRTIHELNETLSNITNEREKLERKVGKRIDNNAPTVIGIDPKIGSLMGESNKHPIETLITQAQRDSAREKSEIRSQLEQLVTGIEGLGGDAVAERTLGVIVADLPEHQLTRQARDRNTYDIVSQTRDPFIKLKENGYTVTTLQDELGVKVTRTATGEIRVNEKILPRSLDTFEYAELSDGILTDERKLLKRFMFDPQLLEDFSNEVDLAFTSPNARKMFALLCEMIHQVPEKFQTPDSQEIFDSIRDAIISQNIQIDPDYLQAIEDTQVNVRNPQLPFDLQQRLNRDRTALYRYIYESETEEEVPPKSLAYQELIKVEDEIQYIKNALAQLNDEGITSQDSLNRVVALGELLEGRYMSKKALEKSIASKVFKVKAEDAFKQSLTVGIRLAEVAAIAAVTYGLITVVKEGIESVGTQYYGGKANDAQDLANQAQRQVIQKNLEVQNLQGSVDTLNSSIAQNSQDVIDLTKQINENQQGISEITRNLQVQPQKVNDLWKTVSELQQQLTPTAQTTTTAMDPAIVARNVTDVQSSTTGMNNLVSNLSNTLKELDYFTNLNEKAPQMISDLTNKIGELNKAINTEGADTAKLQTEISRLLADISELEKETQLSTQTVQAQEAIATAQREVAGKWVNASNIIGSARVVASVVTGMAASAYFLAKAYFKPTR